MQSTALTWYDKQDCSSCHHQTLPMFVFDLARRRGVDVDQKALELMMTKTFSYLANLDQAVQGNQIGFDAFIGLRVVPAAGLGLPHSLSTEVYARLVARRQLADGHWDAIDNRPPQSFSETLSVSAWLLVKALAGGWKSGAAAVRPLPGRTIPMAARCGKARL